MKHRPHTPDRHRLYAIGDIHGRLDLLKQLLAQIEEDADQHPDKNKKLIFLGDYVDRGLDSRGVLDLLRQPFGHGLEPVFIRGNHDQMFVDFVHGNLALAQPWLSLGGAAALASYGINSFSGIGSGKLETLHKNVVDRVPPEHIAFLESTVLSATFGDYYFVHAGVRPHIPLDRQNPTDQMTIRGDFLMSSANFGKMIVHGHTIQLEPDVQNNRIGLDTGAFATGCLSCLIMDGTEQIFLGT